MVGENTEVYCWQLKIFVARQKNSREETSLPLNVVREIPMMRGGVLPALLFAILAVGVSSAAPTVPAPPTNATLEANTQINDSGCAVTRQLLVTVEPLHLPSCRRHCRPTSLASQTG